MPGQNYVSDAGFCLSNKSAYLTDKGKDTKEHTPTVRTRDTSLCGSRQGRLPQLADCRWWTWSITMYTSWSCRGFVRVSAHSCISMCVWVSACVDVYVWASVYNRQRQKFFNLYFFIYSICFILLYYWGNLTNSCTAEMPLFRKIYLFLYLFHFVKYFYF